MTAENQAPEGGPALLSAELLDLCHKHAPDCPTAQAVALGQAVMHRLAAQPQPKGTAALSATELAEMWRLACADWNAQVGARPDPWEHFATRLAAARPSPAGRTLTP
ncbi:hypothetical protein [Roseateles sp. BYS96W]|uniref:Uncharacterized protein n=1 Tax=Pelomonas nitida TaxID=3299027 RepID=A0ABW7G7Q1_9BURK